MAQKAAAAKKADAAKAPVTSVVTPPSSGTSSGSQVLDELGRVEGDTEAFKPPADALVDLNTNTYTVTQNGVIFTFNATDGSIVNAERAPAPEPEIDEESAYPSTKPQQFYQDKNGVTYERQADGSYSLVEIDEESAFPSTPPQQFFEDEYGNTYERQEDGSYNMVSENLDGVYPSTEPERYYEDENGLFYERQADGSYSLISTQEDELPPEPEEDYLDNPYTSDAYYTDDYGNTFQRQDDGSYEFMFGNEELPDTSVDNDPLYWATVDNPEEDNSYYYSDDYYSQFDDFRNGGLITMMKKGGIAKFDTGGYVDNNDGTYTIGYNVYDMETNDLLYSLDDSGNVADVNQSYVYSPEDTNVSTGAYGFPTQRIQPTPDTWPSGYVSNGDGTATKVYSDGSTETIDENNSTIDFTEANAQIAQDFGGGDRPWYSDLGNTLQKGFTGAVNLGSDALSGITGALGTTAGAAGAGALLATLLGQYSSGDSSSQNPGIDMSKVGVINPRTTDFGIGPSRFVGYEDYGTDAGGYAPNEELLRNLNSPGFNPVNEGDYGYEMPAETPAETPQMASGGLSSMRTPVASYYTFGQPADILANLGMRPQPPQNPPEMNAQVGQQQPPQEAQQQGLPQQMPPQMAQQTPQGMPQQGMMPQQQGMPPPMRKGGLPHVSNVPLVEGRMDFRNGSAVHGDGDGQSDDIPAMLADGEYVIDAETVAQIGNGSTKAGAQALDKFRENIRSHKRSAPINKIPPKTKALTSYLKGVK